MLHPDTRASLCIAWGRLNGCLKAAILEICGVFLIFTEIGGDGWLPALGKVQGCSASCNACKILRKERPFHVLCVFERPVVRSLGEKHF